MYIRVITEHVITRRDYIYIYIYIYIYTVAPRYNALRYYADSDITPPVVDPDFLPPGVKWLGCHQSCFAGVVFGRATC